MPGSSRKAKQQAIKDLKARVSKLQKQLEQKQKAKTGDEFLYLKITRKQARFKRIRKNGEPDLGQGLFLLEIDIKALQQTLYFPVSVASSSKPTGFVYTIEGTAEGDISRADISCRGNGITKVKHGTILYAKIPRGKTASFKMLIDIRGKINKNYSIIIQRINYRLDPRDPRYQRIDTEIKSKAQAFR